MRYDSLLDAVGDTPLVGLPSLSPSEDVRFAGGLDAPVGENSTLTILPAVAGGMR